MTYPRDQQRLMIINGHLRNFKELKKKTINKKSKINVLKINTGADVTVISYHPFISAFKTDKPNLKISEQVLLGPGGSPLCSLSVAETVLKKGGKAEKDTVHVISNLHTPLLGTSVSL